MAVKRDRGKLMSNDFVHGLTFDRLESNLTTPYMSQQDSIAEMSNKIIISNVYAIIKWTGYPESFLIPPMETAVYNRNRFTSKVISIVTPSMII